MFKKIIYIITLPFRWLLIGLIYLYKLIISPLIPHTCRFYPSCSKYFIISLKEWGIVKGCFLGTKRLFKCRPKGPCGEDFVPLNIKGDLKWVF